MANSYVCLIKSCVACLSLKSLAVPKESREILSKKSIGCSPIPLDVNTQLSQKREKTSTEYLFSGIYQYQQPQRSALHFFDHNALGAPLPDDRFLMSGPGAASGKCNSRGTERPPYPTLSNATSPRALSASSRVGSQNSIGCRKRRLLCSQYSSSCIC